MFPKVFFFKMNPIKVTNAISYTTERKEVINIPRKIICDEKHKIT